MVQESEVTLQQELSSGDNLSDMIPLPVMDPVKECECQGCYYISRFKYQIKQSFFLGFLLPVMWPINLSAYLYLLFFLDNEVTHSKIDESELPTLFNKQELYDKTSIHLKEEIVQQMDELNIKEGYATISCTDKFSKSDTDNSCSETLITVDSSKGLERYRQEYLLDIANNIISSHDSLRKYHTLWIIRSLFGVLFYVIVALFIYLIVSHNVSRGHAYTEVNV
ncbi:hypothetical protein C6P45_002323 [Maudiozyma exigua]|uniref:Uncharacterized protein n=1 Tax=Maudiozyma exigua TaxID=34358 RepID=A0A9P7B3M9_MAUEX|nr:hypothetical protein C6P45_002323 [Kazachstania exigua]